MMTSEAVSAQLSAFSFILIHRAAQFSTPTRRNEKS
jgi:hypothetical protein